MVIAMMFDLSLTASCLFEGCQPRSDNCWWVEFGIDATVFDLSCLLFR